MTVALLSAGTLSYEVLLVRIFAIEHFHHFAYMAIGIAMLGFGTSGTLMTLLGRLDPERALRWFARSSLLAPLFLVASPALAHLISLDSGRLMWDFSQWIRLAGIYLVLALPFGVAAFAVLVALTVERERAGRIYGASFLGSAAGAVVAIGSLWWFSPVTAVGIPAVVASLGTAVAWLMIHDRRRLHAVGVALAVPAITVAALASPPWRLDVTPYKGLPQVEAYPGATRVAEEASPLGWAVAVDAHAFRHAPGLSLGFHGRFPRQIALFLDGQTVGAATRWEDDAGAAELLDWLPSALAYVLGNRTAVLIIGAGAGLEIENALVHGARSVTALELHPGIVAFHNRFGRLPNSPDDDGNVRWVTEYAREYIARSGKRFDLVAIAPGGVLGGGSAGVYSLNEDYLHTVDAYVGYIELLSEGGVFAVTRWVNVPPRDNVRVILTAAEALRRLEPGAVSRGMLVARSWGTVTILIKPSGFGIPDVDAARVWAGARGVDLDWYPGIQEPAAEFNLLDDPTFYRAAAAAAVGREAAERFAAAYPFEVAPVSDARPYPHHFLRAGSLPEFLKETRGSWLPFAEWGYIALVATLIQAVVLAGLLMLLPVIARRRRVRSGRLPRVTVYFAAIGLAFMAAEIAAIQQLSLLLGHPVYAVAAVLTAFLVCAGAGSIWSDRIRLDAGWLSGVALVCLLLLGAGFLLSLVHVLQPAHLALRAAAALLVLAPASFLMGWQFPLGLRRLTGDDPALVSWAWAANGFASVVAAPLSALIALELGSPALFVAAAGAYGIAALVYRQGGRRESAAAAQGADRRLAGQGGVG
ncbi:MAG: hypothetical protein ACE5HT_11610 [Gemmatimonadales bacterium]